MFSVQENDHMDKKIIEAATLFQPMFSVQENDGITSLPAPAVLEFQPMFSVQENDIIGIYPYNNQWISTHVLCTRERLAKDFAKAFYKSFQPMFSVQENDCKN